MFENKDWYLQLRPIILLFCYCPSSGEPLNGQLGMPESTNHEDEDLRRETDTLSAQSAGTFPVIQPGRFPAHQPEHQVPAVQPPRQNREHNWKQIGKTECTTTCGKGKRFIHHATESKWQTGGFQRGREAACWLFSSSWMHKALLDLAFSVILQAKDMSVLLCVLTLVLKSVKTTSFKMWNTQYVN